MSEKLRKENIVWTVSEDYSYIPSMNLFDTYEDFKMDYYKMSILGYVYKKIDMDAFLEFVSNCISKTMLKNEFLKVIEIYLDDCFSLALIKDRPGIEDFRRYFYDSLNKKYSALKKECSKGFSEKITVEQELEYTYYGLINGNFNQTRDLVVFMSKNLHEKSMNVRKCIDEDVDFMVLTDMLKKDLNAVFLKYFYKNVRYNKKDDDMDFSLETKEKNSIKEEVDNPQRFKFKMKKKNINDLKDGDNIASFSIESAEFTGNTSEDIQIDDERLKSNQNPSIENSNTKVREMILARYGEGIYPEYMIDFIESKICTDIHEGIKLHFTQGKFKDGNYDKYFCNAIQTQKEKNLEYYTDNELIFRRFINELKEVIRKKLFFDEDDDMISRSGDIIISKIWRNQVLGDDNIFMKKSKNEEHDISVDILLDSSASQDGREEIVAAQAYIIAEALVSLNIPTRVYGFSNFFNYLVMREFRDYNDSIAANKNIFEYKTSGSNRDGLAMKFISKQMDSLENSNKVLIVLSDGKPNNKIDLGTVGFMKIDGQDYENEVAIKDTAAEIFNMKMKGYHVLGVFTGDEEDLEDEKKIYGKDFAYIKRLDRFSRIIGFYLEQLIV